MKHIIATTSRHNKRIGIVAAIVVAGFIFLFYGPFDEFRLLWINTAMYSSRYKFLATSLYSKSYIQKVLEQNTSDSAHKTNSEQLKGAYTDQIDFAPIKGNYYQGYIIRIADPRRLMFVQANNNKGSLLEQLVKENSATGGINAGGYRDSKNRGLVDGIAISGGKQIAACNIGQQHTMGGFNTEHKLIVGRFSQEEIVAQNYVWAFEFGPLLIVNGEKVELTPYSGGIAPRTAIGQTQDGSVLLVVVDGRQAKSFGATYRDMQTILFANGAINAIGLDGGSSSSMVYDGVLVNSPQEGDSERLLPNAIVFK
jgi:exopolysaccharide biosynthesis protein